MHAVIMAGGEGTRLRPLTSNQPKPMVPILNKPVMEYIVELVKQHGITDCVATLQFLPQLIKNYFGEGEDYGISMNYALEETPLGTAGSVANAKDHLRETFVVISGDSLTDIDLTALVAFHKKKGAMATLALKRVEDPLQFGVVVTADDGRIERFLEKPTWGEVFSDTINTGIYVLEPEVLEIVPEGRPFDFSQDVFPKLLADGQPLFGFIMDDYWCDIGDFEQYVKAHRDILDGQTRLQPSGMRMSGDVWLGEGASVSPGAQIGEKIVIGRYARVGPGVVLREYTVLGDNSTVQRDAHLHRSIVWENTFIAGGCSLHGAIIGKGCDLKGGVTVEHGAVVGDECVLDKTAHIGPGVKIYPFKRVEAGARVSQSIIWEARGRRQIFGPNGISGLINVDITPDLALRVAMAFGSALPRGSAIVTSRDANRAARIMKRALMAGLASTGVHVRDLRVAPTPINRFTARETRCNGGIHVNVSPFDPESLEIHFFNEAGIDAGAGFARAIERYFYREDYRRAFYDEMGEILFPPRANEYYASELVRHIDSDAIRERGFKIVVDFSYGSSSHVLPDILGRIGCDIVTLNAFTDEERTTVSTEELQFHLGQLSRTVQVFGADFGILLDSACERVFLVDEKGEEVRHEQALLLVLDLVSRFEVRKGDLVLPASFSRLGEQVVNANGRKLRWARDTRPALMEMALDPDVVFVGAQGGAYIFPTFLPAFDAMATACRLLELFALAGRPVSDLLSDLPTAHLAHRNVYCPWDRKAAVMAYMTQAAKDQPAETMDGVKLLDDRGWVMVIPDDEEPHVRVYAEGDSAEDAEGRIVTMSDTLVEVISGGGEGA
jgi:mannose-1-phosphate guanylyltransferase / phosphomannomutase